MIPSFRNVALALIALSAVLLCSRWSSAQTDRLDVTLDWLPSPEYYGFYYAVAKGVYNRAGLQVTFRNASGAPVVAAQLGAGSIPVGSTTSDNVLRQAAQGVRFSRLVPLMLFNPVSIVSLARKPINRVSDLHGVTLGTNPQTSTYAQFEYLLRLNNVSPGTIKEYPIGFGGAAQLLSGEVDAFLAYTTNQAVDVELRDPNAVELLFEESGLRTYGLVLCVIPSSKLTDDVADRFIHASLEGYRLGASDINEATAILRKAEPTLNPQKVSAAISKLTKRNHQASATVPSDLDAWVSLPSGARASIRDELRALYQAGLSQWPH